MWSFGPLVASSLALCLSAVNALAIPEAEPQYGYGPWTPNQQTERELKSMICRNSTIFDPSDAAWANATERYLSNITPDIKLIVRVGCEGDVQKVVKYAYDRKIPIYANNRGHALTSTVSKFSGLEIDIRYLNSTSINPDKKTARFGGGARSAEVIAYLFDRGYQTASGGCGCVSLIGPALGGGHGVQQGTHGLTMDQFVNLNLVLPNGTAITVNANTNSDLWWAMRGAGHNFGIVTSFDSKVWPIPISKYFTRTYYFPGKAHDQVLNEVVKFQANGTMKSTWMGTYGIYNMNETHSTTEATISWIFFYGGPDPEQGKADLAPFDKIEQYGHNDYLTTYKGVFDLLGGDVNGPLCEGNKTHILGTSYLQVYNVTAQRQIYELYNEKVKAQPRLGTTRVLLEGYGMNAVRTFNPDDSAYPSRSENILTNFEVIFNVTNDPLKAYADEWRDQTVDLWYRGQINRQGHVYVNYAAGFETLQARYGYEPWRMERLRSLKSKYDPQNKFAWYNPVIPPK